VASDQPSDASQQPRVASSVPRTVLIGAGGQLGSDIVRTWPADSLVPLAHAAIDVTNREQVRSVIAEQRPELVINTAAFHNVDVCEDEPEKAFAVNAIGAMNVADACHEAGAALMHISTDYVFSGITGRAYSEDDAPDAINVYGVSKAAGEQLVRSRLPAHYIIRTSGLYGVAGASGKGGNFVERMLQLAGEEGRQLRVVDDQTLSPTFTADLAEKLADVAASRQYGTLHVTSSDSCSWYEFARTIFERAGVQADLSPTTTAAFGAKAPRPAYSVLANGALPRIGLSLMRPWQDALQDYLRRKGHAAPAAEVQGGTR
jgi:dTDP-4-dehydrorhamnose reductase